MATIPASQNPIVSSTETAAFVDVSGDSMTGDLVMLAGKKHDFQSADPIADVQYLRFIDKTGAGTVVVGTVFMGVAAQGVTASNPTGQDDRVFGWGINANAQGNPIDATKACVADRAEDWYDTGSIIAIERNIRFTPRSGATKWADSATNPFRYLLGWLINNDTSTAVAGMDCTSISFNNILKQLADSDYQVFKFDCANKLLTCYSSAYILFNTNNVGAIYQKDDGGTARQLLKLNNQGAGAANWLEIGDSNMTGYIWIHSLGLLLDGTKSIYMDSNAGGNNVKAFGYTGAAGVRYLEIGDPARAHDGVKLYSGITFGIQIGTNAADKWSVAGATPSAKEAVTGSRGGNAALADLLTKLATKGIITDSTS